MQKVTNLKLMQISLILKSRNLKINKTKLQPILNQSKTPLKLILIQFTLVIKYHFKNINNLQARNKKQQTNKITQIHLDFINKFNIQINQWQQYIKFLTISISNLIYIQNNQLFITLLHTDTESINHTIPFYIYATNLNFKHAYINASMHASKQPSKQAKTKEMIDTKTKQNRIKISI
ncbi:hypothetical protein ABPG72_019379 [Tetrahymena utriculariae]